jgi:hypothetical protein
MWAAFVVGGGEARESVDVDAIDTLNPGSSIVTLHMQRSGRVGERVLQARFQCTPGNARG